MAEEYEVGGIKARLIVEMSNFNKDIDQAEKKMKGNTQFLHDRDPIFTTGLKNFIHYFITVNAERLIHSAAPWVKSCSFSLSNLLLILWL